METLDAVNCSVSEDMDALATEKDIEDVENGSHVTLARLVHLLARRQPDAHGTQRCKERTPTGADVTRARFHQLTDAAHNLSEDDE